MFYSKNLKKFKGVHHCFFSRKGGFSKGLYKGLNCGRGSNDERAILLKMYCSRMEFTAAW